MQLGKICGTVADICTSLLTETANGRPMAAVLSRRALNRATLARQMLLARRKATVVQAVEKLAGLQAQAPNPPYIGLWSRLEGFRREQLTDALKARRIVRMSTLRATLHLMTASD